MSNRGLNHSYYNNPNLSCLNNVPPVNSEGGLFRLQLSPQEREVLQFGERLLDGIFKKPDPLLAAVKQTAMKFAGLFYRRVAVKHNLPAEVAIKNQFQQWTNLNKKYAQLSPHFAAQFNQKLSVLLNEDPAYGAKIVNMIKDDMLV